MLAFGPHAPMLPKFCDAAKATATQARVSRLETYTSTHGITEITRLAGGPTNLLLGFQPLKSPYKSATQRYAYCESKVGLTRGGRYVSSKKWVETTMVLTSSSGESPRSYLLMRRTNASCRSQFGGAPLNTPEVDSGTQHQGGITVYEIRPLIWLAVCVCVCARRRMRVCDCV